MKKDEFSSVSSIIVYMLLALTIVYIFLLFIQPGRVYDVSLAFLPVLPSVILIVITFWYVKTTHEILKENQLFRKRTFIEGMVKKILFSLLDGIKNVIESFQTKSCYYVKNQECNLEKIRLKNFCFDKFHKYADVFYKTFEKNYSELSKKIKKHDNKLPEIQELINQIMRKISTKEFNDKWIGKINTFEKSRKGREKRFPSFSGDQKSALIDCILNSILQEIKNHNIPDPFWTQHSEEILSERKHYKKEFGHIENKTNETIRLLTELRDDVEKTIISEQEKYGFLAYD